MCRAASSSCPVPCTLYPVPCTLTPLCYVPRSLELLPSTCHTPSATVSSGRMQGRMQGLSTCGAPCRQLLTLCLLAAYAPPRRLPLQLTRCGACRWLGRSPLPPRLSRCGTTVAMGGGRLLYGRMMATSTAAQCSWRSQAAAKSRLPNCASFWPRSLLSRGFRRKAVVCRMTR